MKKYMHYILPTILTGFGLLTLFLSSSVIFDLFGIRAKEGNYVLFIVWANFISSFLYLLAVFGFLKNKKWTFQLLVISTFILIAAYIKLRVYASSGGVYEVKTMTAMVFRISATLVFALFAYYTINIKTKFFN